MCHAAGELDLFYDRNGIIVWIREYLIGVTAAALLCGIIKTFLPEKGTVSTVIKMLLGLLMILSVLGPWVSVSVDGMFDWSQDLSADAQAIVNNAQQDAKDSIRQRIKEQTEEYILAKAETLGAQLQVSIEISDETSAPCAAEISGAISPYAKQVISQVLTDELGINREDQRWIG